MNTRLALLLFPVRRRVQIPLWSMNTENGVWQTKHIKKFRFLYGRWIRNGEGQEFPDVTRSDSSMVDEYWPGNSLQSRPRQVQIPLWSMNTLTRPAARTRSTKFRFLYGRWIREKVGYKITPTAVQIPLWSMNTERSEPLPFSGHSFRFLYGRWIRPGQYQFLPVQY